MMIEFRLLGDVEVLRDGHRIDAGPAMQRRVLAVLLAEANTLVHVDQLVDRVWGDRPPSRVRSSLHSYVTRLRRALAGTPVSIAGRAGGYLLTADEQTVDMHRFRHLIGQARAAADDQQALTLVEQALQLWRGEPFAGMDTPWLYSVRADLERERFQAELDRTDLKLRGGRHAELLPTLAAQAGRYPMDERLVGQFMVALYRSGRQADALSVFQETRRTLDAELGIAPGAELRRLHERMLRADPELTGPPVSARARHNDLPGDVADFVGRRSELDRLLSLTGPGRGNAGVISAIDGMAGIGKTTLAIHVAHRLVEQYPDAQLFVDLHAHTAGHEPVDSAVALDMLLRTLGVPGERIPDGLHARSALWRAELADRKAVVVLDNAASAAQVRPLLAGTANCLTLVTSRRRLVDLEAAHSLSLDVLPATEAINLVERVLGDGRAATEPDAVKELVRLCGCLPLALRIAAARLRSRPMWTVSYLVSRLREGHRRLTELAAGDRSVTVAFALSYQHLSAAQQRMFRLLGLVTGPDIDSCAAAALTGTDPVTAGELLEDLVDAHLLQQTVPGRYRFHSLLRDHAVETAHRAESDADQRTALARLVDFYLHTSFAANRLLRPHLPQIDVGQPSCQPYSLPDEEAAWAWLTAEHANSLAVQQLAVDRGWDDAAWKFAWTLHSFHWRRGHIRDDIRVCRTAMAAAERLGDPVAQTVVHRLLSYSYGRAGQADEAMKHLGHALEFAQHTGDLHSQAQTHGALSVAWEERGDEQRALEHAIQAHRLFQALGLHVWEGFALSAVGWHRARLGQYDQARADCLRALALHREHDDREGEPLTLDNLGYIAHHTGRHAEAVDFYQQALTLHRASGNSYEEPNVLDRVGQAYLALGQHDQARHAWQRALGQYRAQERGEDADRVQHQLADLASPGTGIV